MISRVAEFQGADGENRHSEVLGHEEELRRGFHGSQADQSDQPDDGGAA